MDKVFITEVEETEIYLDERDVNGRNYKKEGHVNTQLEHVGPKILAEVGDAVWKGW